MDEWQDDIEKYLSGKLTPAERHALEKKALHDPFLADALEGAESISSAEFSADVNELSQKFIRGNSNKWNWPLRIAASVIGMVLVSTVLFYSLRKDESQLASTQKPKETKTGEETKLTDTLLTAEAKSKSESDSTPILMEVEKKSDDRKKELIALQSLKNTKEEKQVSGSGAQSNEPASTLSTTSPSKLEADSNTLNGQSGLSLSSVQQNTDSVLDLVEAEVADDEVASAPFRQPVAASTEKKMSRAKSNAPINLIVKGQVRDQSGQPIPGVNISVKDQPIGTMTDVNGKYNITLSESNQTLVYSFIGYVSKEESLSKSKTDQLDVQLEEDATQLSEVVIVGYGSQNSNNEPLVQLAEPRGGRKAYDQYLEDKKVYPPLAIENKIEGKVIIEFTVTTTGTLTDFNIVKKIGYGCEEEVIRLVKEGPQWYPSYIDHKPVESLVRVKTKFNLSARK